MGCGRWNRLGAVIIALVMASCGGTGGGPSDSGNQFVFTARGRLNLVIQPTDDPRKILLTATLLDPQGLPFRDTTVTLTADFPDATFIPGDDNRSAITTDDNGQASVTLIAGLILGKMRILAEAPPALNLATGVTVTLTAQGFVSLGELGIIPAEVTFINPIVKPGDDGPMTIFNAVGGTPPYRWDHTNQDLARIEPTGITNVNETAKYTLTGPLPTDDDALALQDTVRLLDAEGNQATSLVTVVFAECRLDLIPAGAIDQPGTITLENVLGGETAQIGIRNGVPPYTATQTFPEAGDLTIDEAASTVTYTVADPPFASVTDTVLIRDSRGCVGAVNIVYTAATVGVVVVSANPASVPAAGGTSTITALVMTETGVPLEGIVVLFSATAGTFSSNISTTDANGRAQVELTIPADLTGSVTVTASAGGVQGSTDITIIPEPDEGE